RFGVSDTYLAQALDITTAELQTAYQNAYTAAVDKALADGLITQAQADALKQNGMRGRGLGWLINLSGGTLDWDALLAEALGITTDELNAARAEAQSLALDAAVQNGYLTQEQADQIRAELNLQNYLQEQGFFDQLRSLFEGFVQRAVQAGVITQAQADAILSRQNNYGYKFFGGPRGWHGFGGRGFWRGMPAPEGNNTNPSGLFQVPRILDGFSF
ncbi:MAG: hypothetical protein NZ528_11560, partial [Caldilineales bacterium]|nr:hypothetical protein [Caldilineales bacterium]